MRIKLEIKTECIFSTQVSVRVYDLNYGNHVSNDAILRFAHEARVQWLKSMNWSEANIETKGIIMSDAAIQYISEGFLGDQIEIQIHLDDLSRVGFDLYYNMINTTQSKVLAQVKTGILFFDYHNRKVCAVPDEFKNRII